MGVQFRLFIVSFVLIAASFAVANFFLTERVQRAMSVSIRDDMMVRAQLAARVTGAMYAPMSDTASWTVLVNDLARASDSRVTVVRRDGVVIGDSSLTVDKLRTLESHADRPEIIAAFSQGTGASARFSKTLQMDELYVAVPFQRGGVVVGAIRVARPLGAVVEAVDRIRDILLISGALALLMSTIASVFAASWVTSTLAELTKAVKKMIAGDLTARTNVTTKDEIGELGRSIDEFANVAQVTVNQLRQELMAIGAVTAQPMSGPAPAVAKTESLHAGHGHVGGSLAALTLGALGIVFGDIGTSPLYTLHECTSGEHGATPTPENVLGVLSLIFWSLTMVVTVKYLGFIMKADNQGEGGILALLALVPERLRGGIRATNVGWVPVLVLIGAALLYGDGMITPAISVLSAVEGLEVATPALHPLVLPITCAILVGLFAIQRRGTGSVGRLFGPVMVLWFVTIGALGGYQIAHNPGILSALSPHHAVTFFGRHGLHGLAVLGGVVLAVTGGEALYADMGHFGSRPIRLGWWFVAMPALVLNYFGQGALMLRDETALENPFFSLVPAGGWTYALVVLSGLATIIASQALISGAFSLTHQAVQLGYFPRVTVLHTSAEAEGQIYIPQINRVLMIACVVLVLAFQKSSRLAAAYGIAVTGTMAITSIVYFVVAHQTWRWSLAKAVPLLVLFLFFDIPFFASNLLKFLDGGYVPVLVGALFFFVMLTWKRGRGLLAEHFAATTRELAPFIAENQDVTRVPGVGVFMVANRDRAPMALHYHATRMHVLPSTVVLFTLHTEHAPVVADEGRIACEELGAQIYRVVVRAGFMETPKVPELLARALTELKIASDPGEVTYYLGRETFLATKLGKMGAFRETVFAFLTNNADPMSKYFAIPPAQVVEIGGQVDL